MLIKVSFKIDNIQHLFKETNLLPIYKSVPIFFAMSQTKDIIINTSLSDTQHIYNGFLYIEQLHKSFGKD